MESVQKAGFKEFSWALLVVAIAVSLVAGGITGYLISSSPMLEKIKTLEDELSTLNQRVTNLQNAQVIVNTYILGGNVSLADLYEKVKDSVVIVRGVIVQYDIFHRPYYTQVQGSGFIYNCSEQMVVVTNYHVVAGTINLTVTFFDGNGYAAAVLGSDPYADLAVLTVVNAPLHEFKPLEVVSSSTLKVGDVVVAVGNPYGLAGSMSIGIVSALGRTITEEQTGSYPIANVIQTTAPLNPGNSGGPLLNLKGQVVGITTAIVSGSQGLGFAIPSNTILREIADLVTMGYYDKHPWLGASGVDMTYEIARAMGVNITYGWLITQVVSGGPAANAGLRGGTKRVLIAGQYITIGGDIIIAINGTKIIGIDTLSTYLEENTLPGQTVNVTIMREN
ncbi:MAG: trypsin-like peptidase domain-containing protein, partial [Candidatus Bathyarchaeia archaeon]